MVQVCMGKWHQGRMVLVGDAARCPSPLSGMGTSSSLVGANVLAGAINQHSADLPQAFYDEPLRPLKLNATTQASFSG